MNKEIKNLLGFEPFIYSNEYLINPEKGLLIHHKNKKIIGKICVGPTSKEYIQVSILINGERFTKYLHRIIYEHVHGPIPLNKIIDHIDGNTLNNSINNLQCITQQQNVTRIKRTLNQIKMKNKHHVKSTNLNTNEVKYYGSISQCAIDLNINPGMIKMVSENYKNVKKAKSKNDNDYYIFEYINKIDIPNEAIIKYGKIGRKLLYQKNENNKYFCINCNKLFINSSNLKFHNNSLKHIEKFNSQPVEC